MYNGIGLQTPRGSGTNGYIQRNLGFLRPKRTDGKTDPLTVQGSSELTKTAREVRKPNVDLLLHAQKRQIEVKLLELEENLKRDGYSKDKIEQKCSLMRKKLMDELEDKRINNNLVDTVKNGCLEDPKKMDSHEVAYLKEKQMKKLAEAFKIDVDTHKVGEVFDFEKQKEINLENKLLRRQKQDEENRELETIKLKLKKKKKRRSASSSSSCSSSSSPSSSSSNESNSDSSSSSSDSSSSESDTSSGNQSDEKNFKSSKFIRENKKKHKGDLSPKVDKMRKKRRT